MGDWADEEAQEMWEDGGYCGGVSARTIITALRAAYKRGMVEGLREAAEICDTNARPRREIHDRATALEETP